MFIDTVSLAAKLINLDTANPPGREDSAATLLGDLLTSHGFAVSRHELAPGRTSLVARSPGCEPGAAALAFTGHLDTVPFGKRPWTVDPLGAERRDGRIHGRGASDMKAGVAAVVAAAIDVVRDRSSQGGLVLLLTAAEETGCQGALQLVRQDALGRVSGLVVAEPTSNRLVTAHKGALHMRLRASGRTAHGSMPELGDNAVLRAVRAIQALGAFSFGEARHPLLGAPTLAVTTIDGGENVNSIPDSCGFTLDIRTIPGLDHATLLDRLRHDIGDDVTIETLADLPAVGTDPDDPFVRCAGRIIASRVAVEAATATGMPYFTDGSALQPGFGSCPTVIVGPGDPGQAHQTDESCPIDAIETAALIYADIARSWSPGA